MFDPDDESTTFIQTVSQYLPFDISLHPKGLRPKIW